MKKVLTAFEHESIAIGDASGDRVISRAEADRLFELGVERSGFCSPRHRSLKLAQYAGLVNLGGRMLEILPKVSKAPVSPERGRLLLLRMLQLARKVPLYRDQDALHDLRRATLLEVFIRAFFDEVAIIVRAGLLRQYRSEEEDLRLVRGRLLISRQATRNAMRVDQIACRFDDLSVNNLVNRGLKAALVAVHPWIVSADLGRRWIELCAAFDEVPLAPVGAHDLSKLDLDRQASRYRNALQWAAWILSITSPSVRAGDEKAPGLLFDMNKLFEAAVAGILRRSAHPTERITSQSRRTYLASVQATRHSAVELIPDIVRTREGEPIMVADTKWKVLELDARGFASPKQSDFYQLNAYATAHRCREYEIYYPWHPDLDRLRESTFEITDVNSTAAFVRIIAVDLEAAVPRFIRMGPGEAAC